MPRIRTEEAVKEYPHRILHAPEDKRPVSPHLVKFFISVQPIAPKIKSADEPVLFDHNQDDHAQPLTDLVGMIGDGPRGWVTVGSSAKLSHTVRCRCSAHSGGRPITINGLGHSPLNLWLASGCGHRATTANPRYFAHPVWRRPFPYRSVRGFVWMAMWMAGHLGVCPQNEKHHNRLRCLIFKWLGRQDSNLRMRDSKSRALPTWRLPNSGGA